MRKENTSAKYPRFTDPLQWVEHLNELGFGGVQMGVGGWSNDLALQVRARCEKYGMYFEGSMELPKSDADSTRFTAQIELAKAAGASVIRSFCTGRRRYEFFDSHAQFDTFKADSWAALQRAEPVAAKLGIKLAVENHKDLRAEELADFLKRLASAHVGVTFDTGNNVALLEDVPETLAVLAPYVFTLHLKDVAVEECADGFLLSEVVLGAGIVDLKTLIETCVKLNPAVQFNLEMPARDPLLVPVLTKKYWATLDTLPATRLADTLALVRKRKSPTPLPRPSKLGPEEKLAFEEEQLRQCVAYARANLGL
jgi:sugar phosphate isomerase/epimerase